MAGEYTMKKSDTTNELQTLREENARLRAKLQAAQTNNKPAKHSRIRGRQIARWFTMALAGALFVVASLILYFTMTLVKTDRFMEVAKPIGESAAVQQAVATRTTDALFDRVDVEELAVEVLPERVDFLAPEIAKQIETFAQKEAEKILATEGFQQIWQQSVRTAHTRFVTNLENYQGDGNIHVSDIYNRLSERMQEGKLSFLANKTLPSKIGDITVMQVSWLPTASWIVSNVDAVRAFTILLFIGLLALAVWLSVDRRRAFLGIGWMISILSFLMLISLRVVREIAVNAAQPINQQAVRDIWVALATPLALQLIAAILFGLAIVLVAWLAGGSRSSVAIKQRVDKLFKGQVHQSIFHNGENAVSLWFAKFQKMLLVIVAAGFVASFLFVPLNLGSIILLIIIAVTLVAIVRVLAANSTATTQH